jgi:hypothetical protein
LAYNIGSKTYISDTIIKQNGVFNYRNKNYLPHALYKVVLPPNNDYFEMIIDNNNSFFTISTDAKDLQKNVQFIGSNENRLFYQTIKYIALKKEEVKEGGDTQKITEEVIAYQNKIINENPNSYIAFLLSSTKQIEKPNRYNYFDNINFSDDRLLYTSFFEQKLNDYLDNIIIQIADSIKPAVDYVIKQAEKNKENYKLVVTTLLNKYAASSIICFDAVYVHIADNYYCNKRSTIIADWIDAENLNRICTNANKLKPFLCGTIAPDAKLKLLPSSNLSTIKISDVKGTYKVIVFWNAIKELNKDMFAEFDKIYPSLKNKNVEIISIATGTTDANEVDNVLFNYKAKWVNTIDKDNAAKKMYEIEKDNAIFIVNSKNEILYKQLTYSQVETAINKLLQNN